MTLYFCAECGEMFTWVRQGIDTKPECCPFCSSKTVEVIEG